jgi:hypothetical protein
MEIETVMKSAEAAYRRDSLFRRYVDAAVNEAMRHANHGLDEVDPRDLHDVAVAAAMATLRMAIEGDGMLQAVTAERDHYKRLAEETLRLSPQTFVLQTKAE